MPVVITLDHITTAFGHLPLLDDASMEIAAGERIAVIGRNGTGKSTLLRILNGELEPDHGRAWRAPGIRSARLDQDVPLVSSQTVFDVVAEGLGEMATTVTAYHHAAIAVAEDATPARMAELGRLQQVLDETDGWSLEQRVELVLERLSLPADTIVDTLSGGWRRRVLLAKALVSEPDVLLLDEPTNHLDIDAIAWLESFLVEYHGAIVFVTHDRAFLQRLATRIVELDRGRLTSWPGDYTTFLDKKEAWLANEAAAHQEFDKQLAQEEVWLRQGIKARRTRNEGRVKALMRMREERAARRDVLGKVRIGIEAADRSGHVVFEVEDVSFSYGERPVVRDFSARLTRRDRIGLIGPNGAGKTTLLRLLTGTLKPQDGEIHHGSKLEIAYFDQQREQLDPEKTVVDTVADGNDTVTVNGQPRHVHGYLADFLFPPERARSPVKALSGGERNRLLLARLFTRPANVLILDEPTNDLDLETLEILETELLQFPGTVLVVSHDRVFLDNVVTSTLVFEGDGRIVEYVGGYEDWLRQRPGGGTALAAKPEAKSAPAPIPAPGVRSGSAPASASRTGTKSGFVPASSPATTGKGAAAPRSSGLKSSASKSSARKSSAAKPAARDIDTTPRLRDRRTPEPGKLSFKEKQELERLPTRIEALEAEQRAIEAKLASPDFYTGPQDAIRDSVARLEAITAELSGVYARWAELDARTAVARESR